MRRSKLLPLLLTLAMLLAMLPAAALPAAAFIVQDVNVNDWNDLQNALKQDGEIAITLTGNIQRPMPTDAPRPLEVPAGTTATLDLDGYQIDIRDGEGAAFDVGITVLGSLTVTDSSVDAEEAPYGSGGIVNAAYAGVMVIGGDFTLEGGRIIGDGNTYGVAVYARVGEQTTTGSEAVPGVAGSFTMTGGEISGNGLAGVIVTEDVLGLVYGVWIPADTIPIPGSFAMSGGRIGDSSEWGVGVFGSFEMSGGEVGDNALDGVYVSSGGSFAMSDGTITGSGESGVYLRDDSSFEMSGGEISDSGKYGVEIYGDSSFTMSGGLIAGNTKDGVYKGGGGSFEMSDGTITGSGESGVYMWDDSSFEMSGGEISDSGEYGVEIYDDSSFTMSGGLITGNTKDGVFKGGDGSFAMSDGSIVLNDLSGVYVDDGTFTMSGGAIAGNEGDGVVVCGDGRFVLTGDGIIGGTLPLSDDGEPTPVPNGRHGVYVPAPEGNGYHALRGDAADDDADFLMSGGCIVYSPMCGVRVEADRVFRMTGGMLGANGWKALFADGENTTAPAALRADDGADGDGDGDEDGEESLYWPAVNVVGGLMEMTGGSILASPYGVSIGNDAFGGGYLLGSLDLSGGEITDCWEGVFSNGGSVTMSGGRIAENNYGAYLVEDSVFYMYGGEIADNGSYWPGNDAEPAFWIGSGVWLESGSTFTIEGDAAITGNGLIGEVPEDYEEPDVGYTYRAGVNVKEGGVFLMFGGEVSGNGDNGVLVDGGFCWITDGTVADSVKYGVYVDVAETEQQPQAPLAAANDVPPGFYLSGAPEFTGNGEGDVWLSEGDNILLGWQDEEAEVSGVSVAVADPPAEDGERVITAGMNAPEYGSADSFVSAAAGYYVELTDVALDGGDTVLEAALVRGTAVDELSVWFSTGNGVLAEEQDGWEYKTYEGVTWTSETVAAEAGGCTLPAPEELGFAPASEGAEFLYWSCTDEAGAELGQFEPGETVDFDALLELGYWWDEEEFEVDFEAVWEEGGEPEPITDAVSVTYDPGELGGDPYVVEADADATITLLDPAEKFTIPSGWTFTGWEQGEDIYAAGDEYTVTDDVTFKALWQHNDTPGYVFVSTYKITVAESEHGAVTPSVTTASAGATVKITVTPDAGFVLSDLTAKASNGANVVLTKNADGSYSMTMPAADVELTAKYVTSESTCDKGDGCPLKQFSDLDPDAWYHDGIHYVLEKGLMEGFGDGTFRPGLETNRAQIVTVLWRMAGSPVVNYAMTFEDVAEGQWYTEAVRWAESVGIAKGFDRETFAPELTVTREQMCAFLYRYAQLQGKGFTGLWAFELDFSDAGAIEPYAQEAMTWCVMNGIINGVDGQLQPQGFATRAQVAAVIERFCQFVK